MTDESKKVHTTYTGRLTPDLYHLVQEQREVIRQLVRAFGCEAVCPPEHHCEICAAIRAAEPFLED